jgi:hypothetical protein
MKKKLIIYLLLTKTRKFDFERFDAYEIQKSGTVDFEFHEMADFIYPGFSELFTNDRLSEKKIKIFSSFDSWKKEMINKKKIYKENIIVYNNIFEIMNLQSLKVNHFLFKKKFKTIVASSLDHPIYSSNNLINKFKVLFKNLLFNNKKIRLFIQNYFFYNLGKILKIQPIFFLKCGSAYSPYESKTGIKILNGHSRDYNMFLKSKKKICKRKDKFALFLESATPIHNLGDGFISGESHNYKGTAKKWLDSLNNFFSKLEKTFKIKILIVPHPKIKHKNRYSKLYKGREILSENLSVVSKNCEMIISRDSTGFSYAAIYNKPAIFMYNNELIQLNKNLINNQKKFANELGLNPVNIDNNYSKKQILKFKNFNRNSYLSYVKKYLSSRKDRKINYQVIKEAFNY